MLIKSLKYKNFRQFKGENKIEFSSDKEKNITIILGNNTYGKTTLLQMFNWCFYDKAIFRIEDNPKFMLNLEIESEMFNGDAEDVTVEIVLIHQSNEYTITRKQTYLKTNETINIKESQLKVAIKNTSTGITKVVEKTRDMTNIINMILPEDLSGYFLFDTERVQNIAARKDLSSSVKGLMGLTILDNAIKHLGKEGSTTTIIGSFYQDLIKNDNTSLADDCKKVQEYSEEEEKYRLEKEEIEEEINSYAERKEFLENNIRNNEETTEIQNQIDTLNRVIKNEKSYLEDSITSYNKIFGNDSVWFFAKPLFEKAKTLLTETEIENRGVIDVTINTINELIKNGVCLCGNKIEKDNDAYNYLVKQMEFLPPEYIGTTIRNFKDRISFFDKINKENKYFESVKEKVSEITEKRKTIFEWEDDIKELEKKIEGKEDVRKYQLELNNVKIKLKELDNAKLSCFEKEVSSRALKEQYNNKINSNKATSKKIEEIKRYMTYSKKIKEWLEDEYKKEELAVRSNLEEIVNEIFIRMYHGKRRLEINEKYQTTLYTKIENKNTEVISGESEGLIRVKNFAFIAGLVELAKNRVLKVGENQFVNEPYPLILDAPFSNADELHIKNISRELPKVAEQVIMFVMEKDWKYAELEVSEKVGKRYSLEKIRDTYSKIE